MNKKHAVFLCLRVFCFVRGAEIFLLRSGHIMAVNAMGLNLLKDVVRENRKSSEVSRRKGPRVP